MNSLSYRILSTILFLFSAFDSQASLSCVNFFRKQNNPVYYTLADIEHEFPSTVIVYNKSKLYDFFGYSEDADQDSTDTIRETRSLEGLKLSRVNFAAPPSQTQRELHPPSDQIRTRFFERWGQKSFSLPDVFISKISESSLNDIYGYKLAELSNGQLVFVTDPLTKSEQVGQPRVEYDQYDLIEYELFKAGFTPFLAIGKDPDGEFRLVRPVFLGYTDSILDINFSQTEYGRIEDQFRQLRNTDLSFFSQFFHPEVVKAINYYVSSAVTLGRYNDNGELSIVGISRAGLKPWNIDLDTKDKMIIPAQLQNSTHFIGVLDIFIGQILSNMPIEFRIQRVKTLYAQGHLYEVFMAIYMDLLLGGKSYNRDGNLAWQESLFEARIDETTALKPRGWKNSRSLKTHFKKHGEKELKLNTQEEYLQLALDFFESTDRPSVLIKRQETGGYFKYNFETREFGVLNSDLDIITYYQLDELHRSPEEFQGYLAEQLAR